MYYLMSIKPCYAEAILCGRKSVEIRRVHFCATPGDIVLIYATKPVAGIIGYFVIDSIHFEDIDRIWETYGDKTGLSYIEYQKYVEGCKRACAIVVGESHSVSGKKLADIHLRIPQSYMKVSENDFLSLI